MCNGERETNKSGEEDKSYRTLSRFPRSLNAEGVAVCYLDHSGPAGFSGVLEAVSVERQIRAMHCATF
jgi:hypothetical protein